MIIDDVGGGREEYRKLAFVFFFLLFLTGIININKTSMSVAVPKYIVTLNSLTRILLVGT